MAINITFYKYVPASNSYRSEIWSGEVWEVPWEELNGNGWFRSKGDALQWAIDQGDLDLTDEPPSDGGLVLPDPTDGGGSPGSGSGSRGSGGAAGPTYVKPDEGVVRENVKALLVALVGRVDQARLDDLVGVYMAADRSRFDKRESQDVDPMEAVRVKIRSYGDYERIHALRPESADELEWVSSRRGSLVRMGMSETMAEDFAIAQATVGASEQDVIRGGENLMIQQTGTAGDLLKQRFRSMYAPAFRLLK